MCVCVCVHVCVCVYREWRGTEAGAPDIPVYPDAAVPEAESEGLAVQECPQQTAQSGLRLLPAGHPTPSFSAPPQGRIQVLRKGGAYDNYTVRKKCSRLRPLINRLCPLPANDSR